MRILFDIINADGRIDARETFYYNQLKDQLGLKDKDHEHVNEKGSLLALTQISKFNCIIAIIIINSQSTLTAEGNRICDAKGKNRNSHNSRNFS